MNSLTSDNIRQAGQILFNNYWTAYNAPLEIELDDQSQCEPRYFGSILQGVPKKLRHFISHPTSNHNHSETVCPIYLKIIVQRVPMVDYSHRKFQVILINGSRVIAAGSSVRNKVS